MDSRPGMKALLLAFTVMIAVLAPARAVQATVLSDLVGPTPWTAAQMPELREVPGAWSGPALRVGGTLLGVGMETYDYRMLEPTTAVSFDLRLSWPGGDSPVGSPRLHPYAALGPTVFVLDPGDAALPWRTTDPALALGVRGALGLNLRIDAASSMFGEYRVTRGLGDRPGPLRGSDPSGYDLLYGIRVRF